MAPRAQRSSGTRKSPPKSPPQKRSRSRRQRGWQFFWAALLTNIVWGGLGVSTGALIWLAAYAGAIWISLPTMLVRATIAAPQPIAAGAAARHIIQPKKRTNPFTVARNPQSFRRSPAAASPGTGGRRRAAKLYPTALPGALDDRSAANAHRTRMWAKQCQPAARAAGASSAAVGLNGMTPPLPLGASIPRRPQRSIFITTLSALQCQTIFPR